MHFESAKNLDQDTAKSLAIAEPDNGLIKKETPKNSQQARFYLAPMAGWTNLAFRRLCHRAGSDFNTTELVSARGIVYNGLGPSWRYLQIDPATEGKVAIQLFGSEPADFVEALQQILAEPRLAGVSAIDINMGCPVKKVCQIGAGSALMAREEVATAIIRALKPLCERNNLLLTAKFRKGFARNDANAPEFAVALAEAGVDRVCVHTRTAAQMYSGAADLKLIGKVRTALDQAGFSKLELVANGDIKNYAAWQTVYNIGANSAMLGRAVCGNPWLFQTLKNYPEPVIITSEEKVAALQACFKDMVELFGEYTASREFRTIIMPWLKGYKAARDLRTVCANLDSVASWQEFIGQLINFFSDN